jgi:hypothetical protein
MAAARLLPRAMGRGPLPCMSAALRRQLAGAGGRYGRAARGPADAARSRLEADIIWTYARNVTTVADINLLASSPERPRGGESRRAHSIEH